MVQVDLALARALPYRGFCAPRHLRHAAGHASTSCPSRASGGFMATDKSIGELAARLDRIEAALAAFRVPQGSCS